MSSKRKKPLPVQPEEPKPRESECPLEWAGDSTSDILQHHPLTLGRVVEEILRGTYIAPDFQRPFVWSTDQMVRLIGSIMEGYPIGSIQVWRQKIPGERRYQLGDLSFDFPVPREVSLVVDGQQRLTSIAHAFASDRFAYDFSKRKIVVDQQEGDEILALKWIVPSSFTKDQSTIRDRIFEFYDASKYGVHKYCWLQRQFQYFVSFVQMPSGWPLSKVVESYRRNAVEGTPISAQHLEEGIKRLYGSR